MVSDVVTVTVLRDWASDAVIVRDWVSVAVILPGWVSDATIVTSTARDFETVVCMGARGFWSRGGATCYASVSDFFVALTMTIVVAA